MTAALTFTAKAGAFLAKLEAIPHLGKCSIERLLDATTETNQGGQTSRQGRARSLNVESQENCRIEKRRCGDGTPASSVESGAHK